MKKMKKGEFFIINKELTKLTLEKEYTQLNYRVLFSLMNRINFNNRIGTFRQMKLAEEIKTSQSNISKSLKKLLADEIIEKRNNDYYFTESFIKTATEGVRNS